MNVFKKNTKTEKCDDPKLSCACLKKLERYEDVKREVVHIELYIKKCNEILKKLNNGGKEYEYPSFHGETVGYDNIEFHKYMIKQLSRNQNKLKELIEEFNSL
jgi:hypothetical protein